MKSQSGPCGFDTVDTMREGLLPREKKQRDKDTLGFGKIFTI